MCNDLNVPNDLYFFLFIFVSPFDENENWKRNAWEHRFLFSLVMKNKNEAKHIHRHTHVKKEEEELLPLESHVFWLQQPFWSCFVCVKFNSCLDFVTILQPFSIFMTRNCLLCRLLSPSVHHITITIAVVVNSRYTFILIPVQRCYDIECGKLPFRHISYPCNAQ